MLFDGEIHVHYGFIYLSTEDDQPELMETRRGQRNGLCGAAVVGVLSMVTGTHTGVVRLCVEWLAAEPSLDARWEDVVEVSFTPLTTDATLSAFEEFHPMRLHTVDNLRARFCANGMDDARRQDAVPDGRPATTERYLLQLWPAEPGPDVVLRETSRFAGYWHAEARALPPPPSAAEREAAARAAAEQARLAAEQAAGLVRGREKCRSGPLVSRVAAVRRCPGSPATRRPSRSAARNHPEWTEPASSPARPSAPTAAEPWSGRA
jgi:hypothetical protein